MAKKHLLYIHHEQFASEPNKSGLVNHLLSRHYGIVSFKDATALADLTFGPPACSHPKVNGDCKTKTCPLYTVATESWTG